MDTERIECPECGQRFDMDEGAASVVCPSCQNHFRVMRSENARMLLSDQEAGDGTGCLVLLLIVAAVVFFIVSGQRP